MISKWPMSSKRTAYYSPLLDVLDNLMAQHDAATPQWVEASATAADGTVYWARVPKGHGILFTDEQCAQIRANELAQCRCTKEA
jgi:hypothetical protein